MIKDSISIVLAVHNQEELIEDVVKGILNNISNNVEDMFIILADCTDNSESKILMALSKFDWTKAEYDFNYPLELSSSLYRLKDLYPILKNGCYNNPNELEYLLSINSGIFKKNYLLCYENSVAFSNPINRVQKTNNNKFALEYSYDVELLLEMFLDEFRIETTVFEDFMPHGCHEETEFLFIKGENEND